VLGRLKRNPRTRHIPVHVISVVDRVKRGATLGAFAYLEKPVTQDAIEVALAGVGSALDRKVKRLLIVEDDPTAREALSALLGEGDDVEVTAVWSAADARAKLDESAYDCLVVDLVLPDEDGVELIEQIKAQPRFENLPIIVYTGKEIAADEEQRLRRSAESVIRKGELRSMDRLVSDTALFLMRVERGLPEAARRSIREIAAADYPLAGKTVLVIDDDARNIFAMTSVLEDHHIRVLFAENGRAGLEVLEANPDIALVLTDIMMPEMDGYETMRAIRRNPEYRALPLIAITAKALRDDRDNCIAAGANDYLPKPVDEAKLLELVQLWVLDRAPAKTS
jgi:CheY-like chemotaxis protein